MTSRSARPPRGGVSLVESAAAAAVLIVALTITLQVVAVVARERREAERRQRATVEAANLMERLTAQPFDRLTAEALSEIALAPEAAVALPGGTIGATVADDEPGLKRLTVEVRWRDRSGAEGPGSTLRLSSWVGRRGRAEP